MTNKPTPHNDKWINNTNEENPLLPHITDDLTENLREQDIQALREAFDWLFGKWAMTPEREETLKKFNLMGLMLSDEERETTTEQKTKRLCQYWQDLAHLSLGVYTTLTPAIVNIDFPEKSGSYKFIFLAPGVVLGKQFTLMAGEEGYHRNIFERYKDGNITDENAPYKKLLNHSDQVTILGGWRIDLDVEKKHIKFHGSSGGYGFVSDKIIEWATISLRDNGWSTEISMHHTWKM